MSSKNKYRINSYVSPNAPNYTTRNLSSSSMSPSHGDKKSKTIVSPDVYVLLTNDNVITRPPINSFDDLTNPPLSVGISVYRST